MADISNHDLRVKLERRLDGLRETRQPWESPNREVSNYCERWQSGYMRNLGSRRTAESTGWKGAANNRLYNAKAVSAFRTLANGMSSGMSSPSQPWFVLKAEDPSLQNSQAVKEWIDDTTETMRSFLSSTNIYTAMQSGYRELGLFGVEAGLMVPHWNYGAACYSLTWGEYWIGQDDALRTDTLYRDAAMTVGQLFDKPNFDQSAISDAAKRLHTAGRLDAVVPVMHAIEPNREKAYGKIDKTNMPYRSVYWEPGNDKSKDVLEFGGFQERPFWAARWDVQGMEVYASGPGMDCYPESRKLQLQELRLQQSMDYTIKPPLQAPVSARNATANLIPGGITYSAGADEGAFKEIWRVDPAAIPNISGDIQRTEAAIDVLSYAGTFNAFTGISGSDYKNLEMVARKHEEQMAQLGPVVDRVQVEKLAVIVMQTFSICSKAGFLRPVPDELNGQPIKVEFVSMLSQAQKIIGLGAMERALGFLGNIAGVYPQILDVADLDDAYRVYNERLGTPAKTLRSVEDVDARREAQAQQAQQEKMAAMAPALKDGAQAAELLSRTDVGGRPALDAILRPGV